MVGRDAGERQVEWSVRGVDAPRENVSADEALARVRAAVEESGR